MRQIQYRRKKGMVFEDLPIGVDRIADSNPSKWLDQPGVDQRSNVLRLAVQHPARLLRRETGRAATKSPRKIAQAGIVGTGICSVFEIV